MPAKPATVAKVCQPRVYSAVARRRLFDRLDAARERPLIWVNGPPGAGKTTLVASYLADRQAPSLWCQLDAGDCDAAAFFYYLSLAFTQTRSERRAGQNNAKPLPLFSSEYLRDVPAFARRFFRQLFSAVPSNTVLVLDNFQEVDAPIAQLLREACPEAPPGTSLIVISRSEPPAALAELRAREWLTSIDRLELRLSLEETRSLCVAKGVTDDWLIRALHEQSDGWAAGVTLMLERVKRARPGSPESLPESRELVFDYFASLIFDRASSDEQSILLSIAFLGNITPSMAVELSGDTSARGVLERLYRRGMFVERRSGNEVRYQIHALFQEFLRGRAAARLDPLELNHLIARSASALHRVGDLEEAFSLFLQVQDWASARRLVVEAASALLAAGRRKTLEQWIRRLPEQALSSEPWLLYWLGRVVVHADRDRGRQILEAAHARFAFDSHSVGRTRAASAILRTCDFGNTFGEYEVLRRWVDELSSAVRALGEPGQVESQVESYDALVQAGLYLSHWDPAITSWVERLRALVTQELPVDLRVSATVPLIEWAYYIGDFAGGERLFHSIEPLFDQAGASVRDVFWSLILFGSILRQQGRFEETAARYREAEQLAQESGWPESTLVATMYRYMVERDLGEHAASNATLARFASLPAPGDPFASAHWHMFRGRAAQDESRLNEAARLIRQSQDQVDLAGGAFHRAFWGLYNAGMLIETGDVETAQRYLTLAQAYFDSMPLFQNLRAPLMLVQSAMAHKTGKLDECLELFEQAMQLARLHNSRCYLLQLDYTMRRLFPIALERDIDADYVRSIISLFRLAPPSADTEAWPWRLCVRTLGRFEVRVNDRPLEYSRKIPKKMLMLLKVLVALGPHEVSEQALVDALWPDEEGDAAHRSLGVTVLRLRRLLGDADLIRQQGGRLFLDRSKCWVDAWAFERRLSASADDGNAQESLGARLVSALDLYRGEFLAGDEAQPWTVPVRERLRAKFVHAVVAGGRQLEDAKRWETAIEWYSKGLECDAVVESFYQGLMRCYCNLDRRSEAILIYHRLEQTLSICLGITPSSTTQRLYRTLRSD